MNKLKYVILILENCESIKINSENIESLVYFIDGTTSSYLYSKNIIDSISCNHFYMIINNLDKLVYTNNFNYKEYKVIDRLSIPDITHVEIKFENNKSIYFYVPYEDFGKFYGCSYYQTLKKMRYRYYPEIQRWQLEIKKCPKIVAKFRQIKRKLRLTKIGYTPKIPKWEWNIRFIKSTYKDWRYRKNKKKEKNNG